VEARHGTNRFRPIGQWLSDGFVRPKELDVIRSRAEPVTEVSDAELIRLSGADPETFGRVFDRHAAIIHRYLARRAGRMLADDLTAETFLVAFRSRSRYALEQPDALPWLYGIAANLLRGHQRTEVRMYRALARAGADPAFAGPDDRVPAQVSAAVEVRALAGVLAKLPVGEREVLTLVSQAQLTYSEVAQALDIPVGTVRSRLHSARKRLRAALDMNGAIDE
jgi:RNA polymerase sigma-70 factor (ECF subfamily)